MASKTYEELLDAVVRSASETFGSLPDDPTTAQDVQAYLAGQKDLGAGAVVASLSISHFIKVNVAEQWSYAKDALWAAIQQKAESTMSPPSSWTYDDTLGSIAAYLDSGLPGEEDTPLRT